MVYIFQFTLFGVMFTEGSSMLDIKIHIRILFLKLAVMYYHFKYDIYWSLKKQ